LFFCARKYRLATHRLPSLLSMTNLRPEVAIQSAILRRLRDVRVGDLLFSSQVGDRPVDLENPVVGARREASFGDRAFEQRLRPCAELAIFPLRNQFE
jgi:hypothetical protein